MSIDYVKLGLVAKRLIESNGRLIKLQSPSEVPSDATMPWRGRDPTEDEEVQCLACIFDDKLTAEVGDETKRNTRTLFVAQQSALTGGGDQIDLRGFTKFIDTDGSAFEVEEVIPLNPGSVCLMYEFHLKQ